MKTLPLLTLFATLLIIGTSCGGDNKTGNKDSEEETTTHQDGKFSALEGLITAQIPDQYTIEGEGINAKDDHRLYITVDNDREFYDIMDHDFAEIIDPNKEVKVDGLPALTNKYKYQANGDMIARTWLIYNGTDQIQITVQAPLSGWDDAIANDLITYMKINERKSNVNLPEPMEEAYHIRPETFPEAGLKMFEDHLSEEVVLNTDAINNAMAFHKAMTMLKKEDIKDSEEEQKAYLDELAIENGLNDYTHFEQIVMSSNIAYTFMGSFLEIEGIDENSADHELSYDILKSAVEQGHLSLADVRFVYDEWELVKGFIKQLEAANEANSHEE